MLKDKGFTLIELMVVIAIISILTSMAILTFQYFVAKSQVNRVISEAGSLKAMIDYCITEGRTTLANSSNVAPNECDPAATGSNLQSSVGTNSAPTLVLPIGMGAPIVYLNVNGSAAIVATFGNHAAFVLQRTPGTITWSRNIEGQWTCHSAGFEEKLVPESCSL
ncbi:pilin [Acinetobacter courvalinii]|uniref:pilin n=1 Tax=Acinetobacter courvalinii TaxID=280147 RepID=UPI001901C2C9|nr:pilin [Acinetobacter courvalinii]MBJ9956538.1 pilin [Acinetobacter courvalinii]